MERWKNMQFSKEEEEGMIAATKEVYKEESFQITLAGKL